MTDRTIQSGFSAVELLITLFIAFMFIMMGYQLYGAVIKDGGESRARAQASNDAYVWLRQYQSAAETMTCPVSPSTPSPGITVTITCPQSALPSLKLVTVKAVRGNPPQEVTHAIYSSK